MTLKDVVNKYHKVVLYMATIGLLVYGLMSIIVPEVLAAGFERFVNQDWIQFELGNDMVASYIVLLWRLIGIFNLMAGIVLTLMVWKLMEQGNRWSWIVVFLGTSLAYLGPMITDLTVDSIEIFEIIEFSLFAIFVIVMLIVRDLYFSGVETGR